MRPVRKSDRYDPFGKPRQSGGGVPFILVALFGLAFAVFCGAGAVLFNLAMRGVDDESFPTADAPPLLERVFGGNSVIPSIPGVTSSNSPATPAGGYRPWTGNERRNILVLGIDQRPNEDPKTTRTDTVILVTLDPISRTAGMMSIPRDLYVPLAGGRGQDRINTAHVYGGQKLAMETVALNFGIPVHHYVRVNFNVVITLVDAVGGVDVFNDADIADYQYPDMNYGYEPFFLKAGWHKLDGKTALKYMRTRHGSSDFSRNKRQQQVILALRDKALNPETFAKLLPQAPVLYRSLRDSIATDLTFSDLMGMAMFGKDLPLEKIARVQLDEKSVQAWTTPAGAQVLIPIRERMAALKTELYFPQGGVPAANEPGKLVLQNGTKTVGLALNLQAPLTAKGYTVLRVESAPQTTPKSVIYDLHNKPALARQLAESLKLPASAVQARPDAGNSADLIVVLGDDFSP